MTIKSHIQCVLWMGIFFTGCTTTQSNLNSTLWIQTSSEYKAHAIETYNSAKKSLQQALKDKKWTATLEQQNKSYASLPPAIIVDIDETVLDNSPYAAQLLKDGTSYTYRTWDEWVMLKSAKSVPGSVDFINHAKNLGIEIIYITNRNCQPRPNDNAICPQKRDTIANLLQIGIKDIQETNVLLQDEKPEWTSEKKSRREAIALKYRILMLFGNDLGDFLPYVRTHITPEKRDALVQTYATYWGEKWFMLSAPTYGSWMDILKDPKSNYLKGYRKSN